MLTVDEEIYRLTPALVIATVDKLAQLPWRGRQRRCSAWWTASARGTAGRTRSSPGSAGPGIPAVAGLPAAVPVPAMRLRPPDLIIQDELHLISDALGSMVGLYETAVDRLCTRQSAGGPVRPVLVASTATVRRARDQVEQVFARGLAVFPPQVIDAGETFFSRMVRTWPGHPRPPLPRRAARPASG